MPYVMVPVPEEHVEEVMQFLLRAMAKANQEDWDTGSLTALFNEVDELSKTLLSVVARSTMKGEDIHENDAARAVQLSQRETLAIVRELNEFARELNHPPLLTRKLSTKLLPNGRTQERWAITMEAEIAALVVEAERADLASNPVTDPLT